MKLKRLSTKSTGGLKLLESHTGRLFFGAFNRLGQDTSLKSQDVSYDSIGTVIAKHGYGSHPTYREENYGIC